MKRSIVLEAQTFIIIITQLKNFIIILISFKVLLVLCKVMQANKIPLHTSENY